MEALRADRTITDLTDALALLTEQVNDALALRYDEQSPLPDARDVRKAWEVFQTAQAKQDLPAVDAALRRLDSLIRGAASARSQEAHINDLLERTRRMSESKEKADAMAQNYVPKTEAMASFDALFQSILRHVGDREVVAAIVRDFRPYVARYRG
jgi:hypothetical protein